MNLEFNNITFLPPALSNILPLCRKETSGAIKPFFSSTIRYPPSEILERGPDSVQQYFKEQTAFQHLGQGSLTYPQRIVIVLTAGHIL